MNITEHALMRYAQRFENENILNENAFKLWKQENEEKKEKYEKRINVLFQGAEFLTEGIYDNNKKEASFYISEEENILFVLDKGKSNLVTVYSIDFGVSFNGNKAILKEFISFIKDMEAEKEAFENKWSEEHKSLIRKKKDLEYEKEEYKVKTKKIELEQQSINKQIELSNEKNKSYKASLQNAYRKVIKSIEF